MIRKPHILVNYTHQACFSLTLHVGFRAAFLCVFSNLRMDKCFHSTREAKLHKHISGVKLLHRSDTQHFSSCFTRQSPWSVAHSCLTLCNPSGSSVHRILQARMLEWVAIPFSRILSNSGIKPGSPALQTDCTLTEPPGKP